MNKILWFRYDLRLENNESAIEVLKDGYVLPIFIFDEDFLKLETSSSFHVQFTIQSLVELRKVFKQKYNTKLNIYYGDTKEIINNVNYFLDEKADLLISSRYLKNSKILNDIIF